MHQNYPVSTPIQLSQTLKALRHAAGLSQEEVGTRLGVNQQRVARIEAKPERASFEQISRLVCALGGRLMLEVVPQQKTDEKSNQAW